MMKLVAVCVVVCAHVVLGFVNQNPTGNQYQSYNQVQAKGTNGFSGFSNNMPTAVERLVYNHVDPVNHNHGYPMPNQGHSMMNSGYNMMNTQTTYMGNDGNNGYQGNRKTSPFSAMLPYLFGADFGSDLMTMSLMMNSGSNAALPMYMMSNEGEMSSMLPMMAAMKGGNLGMSNPFLTSMMMANM